MSWSSTLAQSSGESSGDGSEEGIVSQRHPSEPLPGRRADLTTEWFQAAVATPLGLGNDVDTIVVEELTHAGFMCDLFRVVPQWRSVPADNVPHSFIVKLPPSDPGGYEVGAMLNAWQREGAFYREIAPRSPTTAVPRCFHNAADPAAGRWVLVLEELPSDEITDTVGASPAQARRALDALAQMHARWWQSPTAFEWMPGFDGRGVGGLQPLWLTNIPIFLDRYRHLIPAATEEWLVAFAPQLGAWSDKAASEPLTIVHADFRNDNLIYHRGDVTVLDWQTALRGPAAMDVAGFLATSLEIDVRRANESALIDHYLAQLANAGVEVERPWFETSLDENLLWWMGQFANNLAHLRPPPDAQERLDTMAARAYQMAHDRNVGRLLLR